MVPISSIEDLLARVLGEAVELPAHTPRRRPRKPLPREVELELVAEHRRYLDASGKLTDVMCAARLRGASLAEIGRPLGMTRQAVHNRIEKRRT